MSTIAGLASAYSVDIAGTRRAKFTPGPDVAVGDPELQFSTGANVGFHIPAKTKQAVFDPAAPSLQIGTLWRVALSE